MCLGCVLRLLGGGVEEFYESVGRMVAGWVGGGLPYWCLGRSKLIASTAKMNEGVYVYVTSKNIGSEDTCFNGFAAVRG